MTSSGVSEIGGQPDGAASRRLHDLDRPPAVDPALVAFAADCDRLAVGCLIGPTPLASVVFIHPVGGVGSRSHGLRPFRTWSADVELDHG